MQRKIVFEKGEFYHLFNRSSARTIIFNNRQDFINMRRRVEYYQSCHTPLSFQHIARQAQKRNENIDSLLAGIRATTNPKVGIVAYCLMPTHIHFLLEQFVDNGIVNFMGLIQNSYAKYFNTKFLRYGPLWGGRFGARHVSSMEDLFHLTRYIHLNPVTSSFVDRPESWEFSSYPEYIGTIRDEKRICSTNIFSIKEKEYQKAVEEEIITQCNLKKIKDCLDPW